MKRKLGELLIEAGAVSPEDVDAALAEQSAGEPSRLGDLLLSTGKCTPNALARALAVQHDMPFTDLSSVDPEASGRVPLEFQRAHRIVPFRLDRETGATRIHLAIADPTITDVVDELRSQLKREIVVHVAAIDDIEKVHAALAGEGAEEPVVMGEVLEEEPQTAEVAPFGAPPSAPALGPDPFDFGEPMPAGGPFEFPAAPDPAPVPAPAVTTPAVTLPPVDTFDFPEPPPPDLSAFGEVPVDLSADDVPVPVADPPAPPPVAVAPAAAAAAPPPPSAPPAASPTEEDLFGELDLPAAPEAPLTTALADEIGRHDLAPPAQESVGFAALSPPLGDAEDRFGARASSPAMPRPAPSPVPLKPERPLTAPPEPSAPAPQPSAEPPPPVAVAPAAEPAPAPAPAPEAELLLDAEIVAEPPPAAEPAPAPVPEVPSVAVVPAPLVSPMPDLPPEVKESTQKFAGATDVAKIPSFAIPPEVPVPSRTKPAALGRIALKRVAVNRAGEAVTLPTPAPEPAPPPPAPAPVPVPAPLPPPPAPVAAPPPPPVAAAVPASDPALDLPDWMRTPADPAPLAAVLPLPVGGVSGALETLLADVASGALPSGPVLAAVLRLLVERKVIDDAALAAALEKLK